jgi:hypothetical protein
VGKQIMLQQMPVLQPPISRQFQVRISISHFSVVSDVNKILCNNKFPSDYGIMQDKYACSVLEMQHELSENLVTFCHSLVWPIGILFCNM